ncbi:MAG TPA: polysaccharide biosynthesis/export family protein [Isosphaeraceae bacterium]|jgi:polysaccharide export outer membrane protein
MNARMPSARGRALGFALAGLAASLAGCQALNQHQEDKIPQLGWIDPHQPRELQMVSHPSYVVEPPDELEVAVRPAAFDFTTSNLVVQADGTIDLGFDGTVYVAGLTLEQVEQKVAQHLTGVAARRRLRPEAPIEVSVRLVNGTQSKVYYVLGTVSSQASFPITGNERVVDAILRAGLRTNSLPEKAYLVRPHPVGGPDLILKIDWLGITQRGDTLTNYEILPGDRIYVPGTRAPGLLSSLLGGG